MDGNYTPHSPRTVEEVYRDFKGRRAGLLKALTNDVEDFFKQCDPEKENLCLYGFPSEQWEVNLPAEEIPPELPEPALGINFARDGMLLDDWLALVAVHSDAWLISVAFYFGARFGFDRAERKRLFDMINDLPTLFEVVSRKNNGRNLGSFRCYKSKPTVKLPVLDPQAMNNTKGSQLQDEEVEDDDDEEEEEEEEEDEHADALCGACGENYGSGEFWICCDVCEKWFHGKCVKITPAKAEHIKQYKCPTCSFNKRSRPS